MNCSCCGKTKRLLESFEKLDENVSVCVECSKKLYKFQDLKHNKKEAEATKILEEIKKNGNSSGFSKWLKAFLLRFDSKNE